MPELTTLGIASLASRPTRMQFIANGNSITAYGNRNDVYGGYFPRSEIGAALQFADPNMYQGDGCDASPDFNASYFDPAGNFGHPAQELDVILDANQSTWFNILDYARIDPDLVIGHALVENDIYFSRSLATIQARIQAWLTQIRTKYPRAVIQLCTNRPDGRITGSASKLAVAAGVYAYIMSLDDSQSIFVTDLSYTAARDLSLDWAPKAGMAYLSSVSESLTDQGGIHPRESMASIHGKLIAATWRRITGSTKTGFGVVQSRNIGLTGSFAFSSGKVTGTVPTNCSEAIQPAGTSATLVYTALNPGWRAVFTPDPGTLKDSFRMRLGSYAPSPMPKRFLMAGKVTINSGASILGSITGQVVVVYSDASTSTHALKNIAVVSGNTVVSEVFADGDAINLTSAPVTFTAGKTPSSISLDVLVFTNGAGSGPLNITCSLLGITPLETPGLVVAITPGASPYAYQNVSGRPQDVIVSGGTVSAIAFSRDGTTYYATGQTAGMFRLEVGDFLKVTYSSAPTMTAVPR